MSELLLITSCSVKVKAKGYIVDAYTKGTIGMMEGRWVSSGGHPVQSDYTGPPRDNCPGSYPGILFSISKDGDSPASQVNLLHCLVTLTGRRCFMMFRGKRLVSVYDHCL